MVPIHDVCLLLFENGRDQRWLVSGVVVLQS